MSTDLVPSALSQVASEEQDFTASLEHGAIVSRLNRYLDAYVAEHNLGRVFMAQTTFRFKGMLPTRYPDITFLTRERLPGTLRMEADFAPDLAVEVISKNDTDFEIDERVIQYQLSGVRLIWVIHPVTQTIAVYRLSNGVKAQILIDEDEVSGEDVIPGFKLQVKKVFE